MRHRVVVTGLGTVAPTGLNVSEVWESALAGRSGLGPITHFDASLLTTRIAGEVRVGRQSFTCHPRTRFVEVPRHELHLAASEAAPAHTHRKLRRSLAGNPDAHLHTSLPQGAAETYAAGAR